MDCQQYLWSPYVPKIQLANRKKYDSKRMFVHRIAYAETVRGRDDEIPTLLFHAPFALLRDVCQYIFRLMAGKVRDLKVCHEHSCRRKNGKCYWRVAVQVVGLEEQFISLKEFTRLLVHRVQTVCNCKVRHYRLDTFLNL